MGMLAVLVLLGTGVVLALGVSGHTPPITDADGRVLPNSIASLERIELGGMEQWILIRGADRSKPILLWLHGGPGGAQMPFAHRVDRELERHFVVVHWDQRGAGKSNHRGFDERTMHLDRYIEDALELTAYLQTRLEVDTLVLLGHSWGTRIGMQLVDRHPELFEAYIGVGQVVHHERATVVAFAWLEETIDAERAPQDWQALMGIEIPARQHSEYRELNRLTTKYGGSLDLSSAELGRIVLAAPEYSFRDYPRLLRGMNRGGRPLHAGGIMQNYDLIESIPVVEVPVYFFAGARDFNTPLPLIREYYEILDAPQKELVVFEEAAHLPFLSQNRRFVEEVVRVVGGMPGSLP